MISNTNNILIPTTTTTSTSATILSNINVNDSKSMQQPSGLESSTDIELIKKRSFNKHVIPLNRIKYSKVKSHQHHHHQQNELHLHKKKKIKTKMHQQTEIFSSIFKLFSRKVSKTNKTSDEASSLCIQAAPTPLKASSVASSTSSSSSSTSSSTESLSLNIFSNSSIKSNSLKANGYSKSLSKCFKSLQINLERDSMVINAKSNSSLGFTLTGYCPCQIAKVERDSLAEHAGLLPGDLVIKINERNVSRATCESLVKIIKNLIATNHRSIKLDLLRKQTVSSSVCKYVLPSKRSASSSTTTTTSAAPLNIVNSTEYSDLNLKPPKNSLLATPCDIASIRTPHQQAFKINRKKKKSVNRRGNDDEHQTDIDENENENEMPSPIPFMSPLKTKKTFYSNDENNNNGNSNKRVLKKKSSVSDSDYKTQSSGATDENDINSLCNDQAERRDEDEPQFDSDAHLNACEHMLNLEERFIELMQKGVQQYSRPLRHCMMISAMQHHGMFQNIEKILAISEYQLNQLISQDDSTLLDMFATIGKLYENKMRMSCEAFDIYLNGIRKSFDLLGSLVDSRQINFSKFLSESQEDIDMDLKTFLLLPLYYVGDIYERLNVLKERTLPNTNDYICLTNLLHGLEVYVNKSTVILNEYNNGQSKNPLRLSLLNNENNNIVDIESDEKIYATSLIHYRQSSHKWKKLQIILLSDKIILVSRHTNAKEVLNMSQSCLNTSKIQFKSICLKNILDINFSLKNECEFQVNYLKSNDVTCIHSIRLKAGSLDEKLNWKKIFSKSLSSLNFDKSIVNNIV